MLFDNGTVMETGTRAVGIAVFGSEMADVINDARWLLLVIVICVLADFRYGCGENGKRYNKAKEKGDKIVMAQYRWRTSRAIRRTVNKLIDYVVWVMLGMYFGIAVMDPLGIDPIFGGVFATLVAVGCEAKSIVGHFFYLHGVRIEEKSVKGFLRAFLVAFAKRKNKDLGEAIEEGLKS